jgi:hypothetical protein
VDADADADAQVMHRIQASGLGPVTPEELEIYRWKNSKSAVHEE